MWFCSCVSFFHSLVRNSPILYVAQASAFAIFNCILGCFPFGEFLLLRKIVVNVN
ncbi:hypothetical protein T08_796 [Trichinella sp. T8]|nr:hypothetical protein T08_796 [Trichinella sp. T8]